MDQSNHQYPFHTVSEQGSVHELPEEEQQFSQHQLQEQSQPPQITTHPMISFQHCALTPHVEAYYPGPYHPDHLDFGTVSTDHDDGEACSEILTRPRLTKEQVEVLEAQFQAHPKPNSNVKRQLAVQTNLTLPRVANWFQNRRAKEKQMKKQEEFVLAQDTSGRERWGTDQQVSSTYAVPLQVNPAASTTKSLQGDSPAAASQTSLSSSAELSSSRDPAHEASWASLQRALDAANNARQQHLQDQDQTFTSLPYRDLQQSLPFTECRDEDHFNASSSSSWATNPPSAEAWNASSQPSEESELDFGFNPQPLDHHDILQDGASSQVESPSVIQGYAISADIWTSAVPTPTSNSHAPTDMAQCGSDALPMSCYPSSTSHPSSDELTATLGQFALTGTPPNMSPATAKGIDHPRKPENHIDIAARRKAPRPAALGPAALGPAALRSQSYGGQTALSPTFRIGRSSHSTQQIRHVRSVGQNLNVKYAGIRKPSPAQRSPLNIATFAEAGTLDEAVAPGKPYHLYERGDQYAPPTPLSNEDVMKSRLPILEEPALMHPAEDVGHQHLARRQSSHLNMVSPPSTPMKAEVFAHPQISGLMPPMSAPAQYAFFPDYTPPYSAGPLTTSSWSDAPLTSPEFNGFSSTAHLPHQSFQPSMMADYGPMVSYPGAFSTHAPVEKKSSEVAPSAVHDHTQTEFLIQEFPRQKEEHAHAAQQLASQRPKNYVFANATPSDF